MESCLDGLRLGVEVPHGGVAISMSVGIALQHMTRRQTWGIVPHLSAPDAGTAAHRLETIMALRVPVADILQEEKWLIEAGLPELLQKPDLLESVSQYWELDKKDQARLKAIGQPTLLANVDRYMNILIEQAKLPYAAQGVRKPVPADPLCEALSRKTGIISFNDTYDVTQNALLLVSLALQAYHAEHGDYPETLAALSPAYLQAVPDDPFALHAPFRYQRTATGYLLYSIGPDGKDNGGTPCPESQKPEDNYLGTESIGDIVAGINIR
jgi:hypothetical protein